MELVTAARRHIIADSTLGGLVGRRVYRHRLEQPVEPFGATAIVVEQNGGWSSGGTSQAECPILRCRVWSDPTRGPAGTFEASDAEDKAFAVARQLVRLFTPVRNRGMFWGAGGTQPGLQVVQCTPYRLPTLVADPTRTKADAESSQAVQVVADWALIVLPST